MLVVLMIKCWFLMIMIDIKIERMLEIRCIYRYKDKNGMFVDFCGMFFLNRVRNIVKVSNIVR